MTEPRYFVSQCNTSDVEINLGPAIVYQRGDELEMNL